MEHPLKGTQIACPEQFGPEPFGLEFLDSTRNPEFIEGLTAERLTAEGASPKNVPTMLLEAYWAFFRGS
jgi:hypothetical protein